MATTRQLTSIATDIVVAKVIEDKLKSLEKEKRGQQEKATSGSASLTGVDADSSSEEALAAQQESADDDLKNWRERRLRQLKSSTWLKTTLLWRLLTGNERKQQADALLQQGNGRYEEIIEEEFLPTVTKSPLVAVHFFSPSFERCKVMHKHLEELALLHRETRFVKLNAEKAPFFCQKLAIRCLPSVVLFKDGVALHTLVGFAELGGVDDFPRKKLEKVLLRHKVVLPNVGERYSDTEDDEEETES